MKFTKEEKQLILNGLWHRLGYCMNKADQDEKEIEAIKTLLDRLTGWTL